MKGFEAEQEEKEDKEEAVGEEEKFFFSSCVFNNWPLSPNRNHRIRTVR